MISTLLFRIAYDLFIYLFCRVSDVVKEVTKEDIPPHKKMLELIPSFSEDEDCESVPTIRYLYL